MLRAWWKQWKTKYKNRKWDKEYIRIPKEAVLEIGSVTPYSSPIPYLVFIGEDEKIYLRTYFKEIENGDYAANRGYNIRPPRGYKEYLGQLAPNLETYQKMSEEEFKSHVYNDYMTLAKG